jgi:hypothetical protein
VAADVAQAVLKVNTPRQLGSGVSMQAESLLKVRSCARLEIALGVELDAAVHADAGPAAPTEFQ